MHGTCGQATGHIPGSQENEIKIPKWGQEKSHRVWRCPLGAIKGHSTGSEVGVVALEPGYPNSNPRLSCVILGNLLNFSVP